MAKRRAFQEGSIGKKTKQRKDGSVYTYWSAQIQLGFKEDGKPNRVTRYGRTQAEVKEKLDKVKREYADGTLSTTKHTVQTWLEEFLASKKNRLKPSTLKVYTDTVNKHLAPALGNTALDKLTPVQVQRFMNKLVKEAQEADAKRLAALEAKGKQAEPIPNVGIAKTNKAREILYSACKQAVRSRVIAINPVDAVDPLPKKQKEMKLWTPEQAARFVDIARGHRLFALFYLAMSTGMRRGELLGLRWQDIGVSQLLVKQSLVKVGSQLVFSTPKTKAGERRVVLAPDVMEVLEQHRQRQLAECGDFEVDTQNLVFVSELGTPVNPDNLRRVRNTLMERAEVPPVRLHDLRHLHASFAILNGTDPKALADRLGHSRASFTLDRYTHLFEEQREASAVSLLDFLPAKQDDAKLSN